MQRLLVKAKQRRRRKGEPLSLGDGTWLGSARTYMNEVKDLLVLKPSRVTAPGTL